MLDSKSKGALPAPSSFFVSVLGGYGSPVAECDFCGRTNFNSNGENMDEGELDRLFASAYREPDKYYAQDGCISHGDLDGRTFVVDCPCNAATRYEQFIWSYRWKILNYLDQRITASKERVDREHALITEVGVGFQSNTELENEVHRLRAVLRLNGISESI